LVAWSGEEEVWLVPLASKPNPVKTSITNDSSFTLSNMESLSHQANIGGRDVFTSLVTTLCVSFHHSTAGHALEFRNLAYLTDSLYRKTVVNIAML